MHRRPRSRRQIARRPRCMSPAHGCQLDRQRLLARGDRRRAPTTSISARRIWPPPTSTRSRPPGSGSASPRTATRNSKSRWPPSPTTSRSGPIYETKLKAMKWGPQGLDKVRDWKRRDRRAAAGRDRRHHAGARARRARGRRRQRRRRSPISSRMPNPEARVQSGSNGRAAYAIRRLERAFRQSAATARSPASR